MDTSSDSSPGTARELRRARLYSRTATARVSRASLNFTISEVRDRGTQLGISSGRSRLRTGVAMRAKASYFPQLTAFDPVRISRAPLERSVGRRVEPLHRNGGELERTLIRWKVQRHTAFLVRNIEVSQCVLSLFPTPTDSITG